MDIRLALMAGIDIPVPECQFVVHQPRIKEIAMIGEEDFFTGIQYLCINKNMFSEDKTALQNTNNFHIFMTVMQEKEAADKKAAVKQVLALTLPQFNVLFTPRSIICNSEDAVGLIIDETNFDFFQDVLRQIFCINSDMNGKHATFNPANKKAKEIADKLMRGRQRVAEQKQSSGSMFAQYISIITVGIASMNLEEALNLTMFQVYDLIQRYTLYTNWDLDVKTRLAGEKPDKQVENWMKNIH